MRASTRKVIVAAIINVVALASMMARYVETVSESGGLLIKVSFDDAFASWDDFEVTCTLLNTSASPIAFVLSSEMRGFSLELLTPLGERARPRPEYASLFVDDERTVGNRRRVEVRPGKSALYVFRPMKLFELDSIAGCHLRVRWGPILGPNGERWPMDEKLTVETTFPMGPRTIQVESGNASNAQAITKKQSKTNVSHAINYAPSVQKKDLQWFIIGGLILALISLIVIQAIRHRGSNRRDR